VVAVEACAVAMQDRDEHHIMRRCVWQGATGNDHFGHFAVLTASLRGNKSTDDRPTMQLHFPPWSIANRKSLLWSYEDYL
jgi:hypothetical protein